MFKFNIYLLKGYFLTNNFKKQYFNSNNNLLLKAALFESIFTSDSVFYAFPLSPLLLFFVRSFHRLSCPNPSH